MKFDVKISWRATDLKIRGLVLVLAGFINQKNFENSNELLGWFRRQPEKILKIQMNNEFLPASAGRNCVKFR